MKLIDRFRQGGLLFDGAIGTQLYERGIYFTQCFEYISLTEPHLLERIHQDYREAGAEVLTTNTWGANRVKLEKHHLADKLRDINLAGVQLARKKAQGAYVVGSIGPTGIDWASASEAEREQAVEALSEQIGILAQTDVDAILLETYTHIEEQTRAIRAARALLGERPVLATFTFTQANDQLDPLYIGKQLIEAGAAVIGANCGGGPELIFNKVEPMVALGVPVLAQANAGRPTAIDGRTLYPANPENFGVYAKRFFKAGVKAVGGCCGTGPEHIRRMAAAARMYGGHLSVEERASQKPKIPLQDRSALGRKLALGQWITSVELTPPAGFDLSKQIRSAQELKAFGVTTVNVTDGPRATMRLGNVLMAQAIAEQTGFEPLVHVCTRDRSLLGLLSHLLDLHKLSLHNLVVITGDPPKMGPYGHSTGVYDVDSIGLLEIISGMNAGVDPTGKALPEPTSFVCATGVEPGAIDYDREIRRLEQKKEAGANLVLTQPVYDPRRFETFLKDVAHIGLPVLVGICPLASLRNARFLNENVPGMQIPDAILSRLEAAEQRGEMEEGIQIAREALSAVRDRVQGVYVMPPFGRHKAAMAVLKDVISPGEAQSFSVEGQPQ